MEARAVPREAVSGSAGLIRPRLLRAATDARLVALVRQGEEAAFEAIYDRYHRPILSFCRHMLGDPEEAADTVQHTFTAAYTAIGSSTKPLLLRAWLFTIARNRCYSVLRSRREHPAGDLVEPATEGLAAQVQRREDLRLLLVDMHYLPEDQRAALVLAELGALNHSEIGTALGVPPGKVKALVFQARESLIASRAARDIDCTEIRRELATARGAALRRANLRRHLRHCQGCREYRREIERQRRNLAVILPVAPAIALKETVLGAASGGGGAGVMASGGGAGGMASGGVLASTAAKGVLLKGLVGGLAALLATTGTIALIHAVEPHATPNALADGTPGAGAAAPGSEALRADTVPFASISATRHGRPMAHRGRGAHAAGVEGRLAIFAAFAAQAAPRHAVAGVRRHREPRHTGAATLHRHHHPAIVPAPHDRGSGSGDSGRVGARGQADGQADGQGDGQADSQGDRHGDGHAWGRDPGHDRGLHRGWGQGDGGGRDHPHSH